MTSDIFTNNLPLQRMERYEKEFYGKDEYHCEQYTEKKKSETRADPANVSAEISKEALKAFIQYNEVFATLIDSS